MIYSLWWKKPFEVDYPTMIKGQILRDMRALHWLSENRSSAAKSFNRDFREYLNEDQWFHRLSVVGLLQN